MKYKIKYYALLIIYFFLNSVVYSQLSILDTSFGNNGISILDPNVDYGTGDRAFDIAHHYEDKLIICGTTGSDIVVSQIDTSGNINRNFGDNGTVIIDNNFYTDEARVIQIDSNKNIYIAANSGWYKQFVVVKLDKYGKMISSYGEKGIATITTNSLLTDMTIDETGKCYLTGSGVMCSLLPDGQLDTNFGENGLVMTGENPSYNYGSLIELTPDNKLLFCGSIGSDTDSVQLVIKSYHPDGKLDTTFGDSGMTFHGSKYYSLFSIRPQDIIIVDSIFYINAYQQGNGYIFAYKLNGEIDSSFGINGVAQIDLDVPLWNSSINIKDEDFILGCIIDRNLAVAKFTQDGLLDTTFNSFGYFVSDINIFINTDNKPLESATIINNSIYQLATDYNDVNPRSFYNKDFVLMKYKINGSVDSLYGDTGKLYINYGTSEGVNKIACTENGKILLAGNALKGYYQYKLLLLRTDTVGSIDTTFNFKCDVDSTYFGISDLIARKEDIFVSLLGRKKSHYEPYIYKINNYGLVDTTFNGIGYITIHDTVYNGYMKMIINENDKILAFWNTYNGCNIYLFNRDGSIDTEFGNQGRVKIDLSDNYELIKDACFTYDNKILLSGTYDYTEYCNLDGCTPMSGQSMIIKLNGDGSYDTTFGTNGVVIVPEAFQFSYIELTQSNQILCSGLEMYKKLCFANFLNSGKPDSTFGENGMIITDIDVSDPEIMRMPNGNILIGTNPMYSYYDAQIDTFLNFNDEFAPYTSYYPVDFTFDGNEGLFISSSSGTGRMNVLKYKLSRVNTPSVQLKDLAFNHISSDTLSLSWTKGNGSKRVIFMSEGINQFPGLDDGTTYYPSHDWSDKGSEIGNSDWYCIYNGNNDSIEISNINNSTFYSIAAFEYNGASRWERYYPEINDGNFIKTGALSIVNQSIVGVIKFTNPCKDYCEIKLDNIENEEINLCVFNMMGEKVDSYNVKSDNIILDTRGYYKGVYLIRIEKNKEFNVFKLVVE